MKRLYTLIACMALLFPCLTQAQFNGAYCDDSNDSICSVAGLLTAPGFTPSNEIPCIVRGAYTELVIEFRAPNSFAPYGWPNPVVVEAARIDSLEFMPDGFCWSSSQGDNTYLANENGCIKIKGLTMAQAGQYKLNIVYSLKIFGEPTLWPSIYHEDIIGESIFLRVINDSADNCPPVDTSASGFSPYENLGNLSRVSGKVFADFNSNGLYDNGEVGLKNIVVSISNQIGITNSSGNYQLYVPVGSHSIQPQVPANNPLVFPNPSIAVTVLDNGLLYGGNNFGATVSPNLCEGSLSITNVDMPPRPGFSNSIMLTFYNSFSSAPLSQIVRLNYSALQSFVAADKALYASDATNRWIEWEINNIAIGQSWSVVVSFGSEVSSSLGEIVSYTASIKEATCESLNSVRTNYELIMVGSYDPNDKAVSPVGYGSWNGVNPDKHEEFTYKIRFQNTGTFLAEKVVIVDTISQHLDLRTLKVLNASHNYEVEIGNERAVKFIFNNIMLPDSNSNEPGSHGYVQYSIKPYTGLAQDVAITNRADIYFDFNSPILTNTTLTTIDYVDHTVGIKEAANGYRLSIYPNPTNSSVQINIDERLLGETLTLSDISGRVLLSTKIEKALMQLDMASYASGVYVVRTGSIVKKVVKE